MAHCECNARSRKGSQEYLLITKFLRTLGPLRTLLLLTAGVLAAAGPFAAGTELCTTPLFSDVFPALVLLLAFLLPLDMLMCRIFRSEQEEKAIQRYAAIMHYELITLALMLAAWAPLWSRLFNA